MAEDRRETHRRVQLALQNQQMEQLLAEAKAKAMANKAALNPVGATGSRGSDQGGMKQWFSKPADAGLKLRTDAHEALRQLYAPQDKPATYPLNLSESPPYKHPSYNRPEQSWLDSALGSVSWPWSNNVRAQLPARDPHPEPRKFNYNNLALPPAELLQGGPQGMATNEPSSYDVAANAIGQLPNVAGYYARDLLQPVPEILEGSRNYLQQFGDYPYNPIYEGLPLTEFFKNVDADIQDPNRLLNLLQFGTVTPEQNVNRYGEGTPRDLSANFPSAIPSDFAHPAYDESPFNDPTNLNGLPVPDQARTVWHPDNLLMRGYQRPQFPPKLEDIQRFQQQGFNLPVPPGPPNMDDKGNYITPTRELPKYPNVKTEQAINPPMRPTTSYTQTGPVAYNDIVGLPAIQGAGAGVAPFRAFSGAPPRNSQDIIRGYQSAADDLRYMQQLSRLPQGISTPEEYERLKREQAIRFDQGSQRENLQRAAMLMEQAASMKLDEPGPFGTRRINPGAAKKYGDIQDQIGLLRDKASMYGERAGSALERDSNADSEQLRLMYDSQNRNEQRQNALDIARMNAEAEVLSSQYRTRPDRPESISQKRGHFELARKYNNTDEKIAGLSVMGLPPQEVARKTEQFNRQDVAMAEVMGAVGAEYAERVPSIFHTLVFNEQNATKPDEVGEVDVTALNKLLQYLASGADPNVVFAAWLKHYNSKANAPQDKSNG